MLEEKYSFDKPSCKDCCECEDSGIESAIDDLTCSYCAGIGLDYQLSEFQDEYLDIY